MAHCHNLEHEDIPRPRHTSVDGGYFDMTRDAPMHRAAVEPNPGGRGLAGRGARRNRGRRLSPTGRKALVAIHTTTSVGLLGADAAVVVLLIAGWRGFDPSAVYPATRLLGQTLILPFALLALASGVALGVLTPWGLLRHWWVLIKLLLTTGGTVLALLVLVPSLDAAAAETLAGRAVADPFGLVTDSASAGGVLIVTILLAYFKPFGRLRRRHR
jgi:hypothetical protein